jgi:murein DD-endopeptidase MepM/ murein hydrolase activator NlpD
VIGQIKESRLGEDRRSSGLMIFILLIVVVAGGFAATGWFRAGGSPEVKISPGLPAIGKRTPIRIDVSETKRGLSRIRVEFIQGNRVEPVAEKTYPLSSWIPFRKPAVSSDSINVEIGRETLSNLKNGDSLIRVTADRIGTWMRHPEPVTQELMIPVRITPPSLQVSSSQTYLAQGGCEVVVYRVGETAVRDGVRAGDWWFPGFPLPGGGKQDRFAIFAAPYDMMQSDKIKLVAVDGAGNEAEAGFIDKFFPKPPKSDSVELSDAFMGKVVPEILSQTPELTDRGSLLNNYLEINGELRRKQNEMLKQFAAKSTPAFLWSKPFLPVRNGKVMANFADRRTYVNQGQAVDHQDHLGIDLAITQHAPVPVTNSGTVVLAKYFGIYGNAVVVDHGYGLMSLYGHLSAIKVTEGQKVAAGDIIGETGATGLAGGDHLHYAVLLQGLPVNPVEWWDGHWIKDRISNKLGQAFKFEQ